MNLLKPAFQAAALALVLVCSSAAQEKDAANDCALRVFDREFRTLIAKQDATKLALLMDFPLRVNDQRGAYLVPDAASFVARFDDVFTPSVRKAVLDDKDEVPCKASRHHYGRGEAHVTEFEKGWAVSTISPTPGARSKTTLRISCWTAKQRILVDTVGETLRLRSWTAPLSLTEKPDVELLSGTETVEGTWPCTHTFWTFQSGTSRFSVSELGCYPDSNQPPPGATGHFVISEGRGKFESSWCM